MSALTGPLPSLHAARDAKLLCVHHDGRSDVPYTAVTSTLESRVGQHKEKGVEGFTKRYHVTSLVYYEVHDDILAAIAREKQIKR